jgi:hypothetical protein
MAIRRFVVPVTVDGDGDAEVYSPVIHSGKLVSIRYAKEDFADGVDFTITSDATGATIWTQENVDAAATRHPRAATHSTAGVAATFNGAVAVLDKIALGSDRIKIVIANGGDATTGTFHITVDS